MCNGWELGSGSVRIYRRDVQEQVFAALAAAGAYRPIQSVLVRAGMSLQPAGPVSGEWSGNWHGRLIHNWPCHRYGVATLAVGMTAYPN